MSTLKEQRASRENGKKSRGPKTAEGKAESSLNATKYGFLARDPLLPGESAEEFAAFRGRLRSALAPVGELEEVLASRIVDASWRLRRFPHFEAQILEAQMWKDVAKNAHSYTEELVIDPLDLSEVAKENRETCLEAAQLEQDAIRAGLDPEVVLGRAWVRDARGGAALTRLGRYEASLERVFTRNMRELQRQQAARASRVGPQRAETVFLQNEPENPVSDEPKAA